MNNNISKFEKLKKYGPIAVFLFFLVKGLLWIIVPALAYYFW